LGRISVGAATEVLQGNRPDRHVHVDSVRQRTGDPRVVPVNVGGSAVARARRISGASARAGIGRAYQRKARWKSHRLCGTRDHDACVLHWLAQSVEDVSGKFKHFVQKQYTVVSKADLTGSRLRPTSNQARARNRMVGRSERPNAFAHSVVIEHARDGMNCNHFQGFVLGERRQNRRKAACEHGLSCARWSDEQDVVSAGGCHLECTLRCLLANDIGEVT
jgi:hypothetical protein